VRKLSRESKIFVTLAQWQVL